APPAAATTAAVSAAAPEPSTSTSVSTSHAGAVLSGAPRRLLSGRARRGGTLAAYGCRRAAVERGALPGGAAEGGGRRGEARGRARGVELVAVDAAGGARDRFVHQGAPEVVGARLEAQRRPLRPHLHPGGLDVGDEGMQHESCDRVHEQYLAQRRPRTRGA